ncbi:MAG TPA: SCO family protein [Bryobacteraceae bacterium]|nr:SCO family protein [Bryobacteraceae bacterium]
MLGLVSVFLAAHTYPVDGIVVAVDRDARTMLVSHRPIGRYMPAMMMPFRVEQAGELEGLYAGARVHFELVVHRASSVARHLVKTADGEIAPPKERLRPGEAVADFSLRDQNGRAARLSDLRGKVVAVDFIYTRCPLPDVCPRLSANFATLQRRFHERLGTDLMLITITVDPQYDTPAVLAGYARRWGADDRGWLFLTGDVAEVAAQLGEVYWTDEGAIGHNSRTTIIGRDGRVAAMVDGSSWRAGQLADLVSHELEGKQ